MSADLPKGPWDDAAEYIGACKPDLCVQSLDGDVCVGACAMAKQSAWLPIETAPKDQQVFLGWVAAERWSAIDGGGSGLGHDVSQVDFCWWRAVPGLPDGGYFDNGAGQIGDGQQVTHWMPLPEAPK